jgi:HKD family nuclease
MVKLIQQPGSPIRVGEWLISNLSDPKWTEFRAAVAFVKISGVSHLAASLTRFSARSRVKLVVGIDAFGTSFEALQLLLECIGPDGELWIFHNEANHLFHPKVYMFRNDTEARVVIGSNNLTGGGLFTNYEFAIELPLDLSSSESRALSQEIEQLLDGYCREETGTALRLNLQVLSDLWTDRYILKEAEISSPTPPYSVMRKRRFKSAPVPPPPAVSRKAAGRTAPVPSSFSPRGFVMTLQQGDAGEGRKTPGTSRRSPEIFLPVRAVRDTAPNFWGWDSLFVPDPQEPNSKSRVVSVLIAGNIHNATIWRNPKKNDFRLRGEAIRSAIHVGDVFRVELAPSGSVYDYEVEGISPGSERYDQYLALCTNLVKGSPKRWGYYV